MAWNDLSRKAERSDTRRGPAVPLHLHEITLTASAGWGGTFAEITGAWASPSTLAMILLSLLTGGILTFLVLQLRLRRLHSIASGGESFRHQAVLLELARTQDATDERRLCQITETLVTTLDVARCGVWVFEREQTELSCIDLYNQQTNTHAAGSKLQMEQYPAYFAALESSLVLAASDARLDPRTAEFSSGYLEPNGIGAMLDVPVRRSGRLMGVVCLEHVGGPRHWSSAEQSFAANVADQVSLYFEARERTRAENALRHSEELHRITLESISDAVFITTLAGDLTFIAPNVHYIFGYSFDEIRVIGNIEKILGPGLFSKEDLQQKGELTNLEREIVDKQGRSHSLLINVKIVNIGVGSVLYSCRDITERRDAEKAVKERGTLAAMDAAVSSCISNAKDVQQVIRQSVTAITTHLSALSAHIWLVDEAGKNLDLAASTGPETHLTEHRRLAVGTGLIGQAASTLKGIYVTCPSEASCEELRSWAKGVMSVAMTPMIVQRRAIGVLGVFAKSAISPAAFAQLENIAGDIASGIDRKHAEAALRSSEQKYRDLVETSHDLIWSIDTLGRWTFVNRAARSIYGIEPSEMLGKRWMDFVCRDFEATDRNAFEELRGGEPLVTYQTAHRRSDGSPVYLLVNARLRTDEQGTMIGVTGTSTNVTDRKRSEEALRESEQRVQLALTGADLGLWDWNIASGEASYNERWARMLGYRVDEVEPTIAFWRKLVHPADRLRVTRLLVAHRRSTIPLLEVELRLRCKSGAWCWVLCRGRIIERDADGGPLRAAGTILDITERKQANEALQVANEQLESKVAERTRELETANERLTELDRLKSEFLATMSHELRTPLNSIIGFVGILLMGLPGEINEEQRKQLQMVKSSATLLLGLINDLLDLSRIESGNMELYRQQFSAQEVLDEVCKSLMPLIEQKQLELHKSVPTESVQIFSDRKRFYQIVLNLLNNAVKFTERGRVDVHLHATEDFISVAIRDTGIGIKQENMGLLFTAFRQVDGSARRNYEGSGLGLHLCRKLLDLLGGDIEVESQFGKGSCFTFWLPRNLKEPKK